MHPEILSIGGITLHSYGLVIASGVFLAIFLMTQAAKKYGFPPHEKIFDMVFVVVLFGFLGSRLLYISQEWAWYREHPLEIFEIWKGGLTYYGGMIVAYLAFFFYVRLNRISFFKGTDFMMPYLSFVHGLGRIGCFLQGCCYGKESTLPWAVRFPQLPAPVHPTQLYEFLFNFGLAGFLIWYYPKRRFVGEITALYLIFYSTGRFLLEFLRGDQQPWLIFYTLPQVMSLGFLFIGMILYGIGRFRR